MSRHWKYGAAQVRSTIDCGVSITKVCGLLLPDTFGQLLADNARWLDDSGALGQVARYDHAAVATTQDELMRRAAQVVLADPALEVPTALVVAPDALAMWRAYADFMCQRGVLRVAFVDLQAALDWAQQEAAVYRSWPARSARAAGQRDASSPAQ